MSDGWRTQVVDQVRHLIHEAAPGVVEEARWSKVISRW